MLIKTKKKISYFGEYLLNIYILLIIDFIKYGTFIIKILDDLIENVLFVKIFKYIKLNNINYV